MRMTAQVITMPTKMLALWIGGPPGNAGYEATRNRLEDLGIFVTRKVGRFDNNSTIPAGTHVVLLNIAFCDHMSQEAAKAQADRRGIPFVRINSKSWPYTIDAILRTAMNVLPPEVLAQEMQRHRSPSSSSPMPLPSEMGAAIGRVEPMATKRRWSDADREQRRQAAEDLLFAGAMATTLNPGHFSDRLNLIDRQRLAREGAMLTEAVLDDVELPLEVGHEPAPEGVIEVAVEVETPEVKAQEMARKRRRVVGARRDGVDDREPEPVITVTRKEPPSPAPAPAPTAIAVPDVISQQRHRLAALDAERAQLTSDIEAMMARLDEVDALRGKVALVVDTFERAMDMARNLDPAPAPAAVPAPPAATMAPEPEPEAAAGRERGALTDAVLRVLRDAKQRDGTGRLSLPELRDALAGETWIHMASLQPCLWRLARQGRVLTSGETRGGVMQTVHRLA